MIRLGLLLGVSGGREALTRLVILAAAVGIGVGLPLTAVSAVNAVNTQNDRYAWLDTGANSGGHGGPAAPLWTLITTDYFHRQTIYRADVAATGPAAPVQPGIPRDPGPGQYYISPALAALLRSAAAGGLADRCPGHQAGLIGEAGLPSPDSLVIVVGRSAAITVRGHRVPFHCSVDAGASAHRYGPPLPASSRPGRGCQPRDLRYGSGISGASRGIAVSGAGCGPHGVATTAAPAERVIALVRGALLHRDDRVIGDLDVGRADLGTALGDVAQAQALPVAQHAVPVPGIQRVHIQLGVPDEVAGPGVGGLVVLVVADHVADVLAQPELDALAELLAAVDVGLLHPVLAGLQAPPPARRTAPAAPSRS